MTHFLLRPLNIRLKVAIIADAAIGPFPPTDVGSTLGRFWTSFKSDMKEEHPYDIMWSAVQLFYDANDWKILSFNNLNRLLDEIAKGGATQLKTYPMDKTSRPLSSQKMSLNVESSEIAAAAKRWVDYGWFNYEEKRNDKLKGVGKGARIATLFGGALIGLPLLSGDE
jgi:hypothetical protein